ncbi:hypothetical protein AGMMS50268_09410 [Spirochaetia bacterium]|nr:hypothetical protein AGMMS50268_09410 [Spirochaetia bacterium]
MVGLPVSLSTKQDWLNAVNYAKATGDGKGTMRARLLELKSNSKMLVLKAAAEVKPPEEQTPEDFKSVDDPNCEKLRIGFTDAEIDQLIGGLD